MTFVKISKERLGKLLRDFKIEAYAGDGKYSDTPYGTKKYVSEKNIWRFTDEYIGDFMFSGVERLERVVTPDKFIGVCQMAYQGRILNTPISSQKIYDFLKEALKAVPVDYPFRGPLGFRSEKPEFKDLSYQNIFRDYSQDLKSAIGKEWVNFENRPVYEGHWIFSLLMENPDDIVIV